MKHYNFKTMRGGWFVGDFYPTALNWQGGEISIKHFPKNHVEVSYCHENARKFYVVLKGALYFDGQVAKKMQIVEILPGENVELIVKENSVVLLAVVGDREFTRFNIESLKKELDCFDSVYPHDEYKGDIPFEDISVVVQGAIEKTVTPICLESIRKFFPGSKIILSTWKGSNTEKLDYDELVLNDDPGGYKYRLKAFHKEFSNNTNRQLVSLQNGLSRVRTKYVLKLRTDMIVTTNEFLNYYDKFAYRSDDYRLFEHKVLIADFYTRHSLRCERGFVPTPFHISDWFFFGLTEDLKTFFAETRIMTKEEQVDYSDIKMPDRREKYDYCWNWRFPPEQYYCIQAVERCFDDIKMNDWSDWDEDIIHKSELFIMNNFIILDFSRHGINLPKYEMNITSNCGNRRYYEKGLYTYDIFKQIYETMQKGGVIPNVWDENPDDDQSFWMFRGEEGNYD